MFASGVPSKIFEPKTEKVTRENLHIFNSKSNIYQIRRMEWVGNVACMQAIRGASRGLVDKPESKRPL